MNNIDDVWPPPDPMNNIDDVAPAAPSLKQRTSPSFEDVLATTPALSGPHHCCPAPHHCRALKRTHTIETEGYTPQPSTIAVHVATAACLPLPTFNTSSMLAALGAYAAWVENKEERYGSKKHCTVVELIQSSFHGTACMLFSPSHSSFIHHNSSDARPLLNSKGRIFLVLAGQPRN
jgi:hypothetical protein